MLTDLTGDFGSVELRETLDDLLGGGVRLIAQQRLSWRRYVYRVQANVGTTSHSFVLKRFSSPHIAQRNQMVVRQWLPAVGLAHAVPALLGIAAERDARHVWHIYEDLGECALAQKEPTTEVGGDRSHHGPRVFHAEPARVVAAVSMIAEIHARFAEYPLLGQCRVSGGNFGSHAFTSTVRDAIHALELLLAPERVSSISRIESLQLLLNDLRGLLGQATARAAALARFGGPETLLHGDLWPINVMVYPDGAELRSSLVDWDHVGVGLVSYDVSNFVGHFPLEDRQWILDEYIRCMERQGWQFPRETDWNLLFDTAERFRLATSVFWRVVTALDNPHDWALDDVVAAGEWFRLLEPTFPPAGAERGVHA